MKKPKNNKWQKNDVTGTMSRHLRCEHVLGAEGEESSDGGQVQLHGYAFDMPDAGMPFVYNRERMITEFGKFVIADELPFSFGESPNNKYFNRVALQPQYRREKSNLLRYPTRWNSTYKLLHDAITYHEVLTDMYNESRADGRFITNDHWSLAKIIHDVIETFDNATHIFSYVYEPNIHIVILECIKVNWCAYFNQFPPIYAIVAILDPSVKLQGVNFDVPYYANKCKHYYKKHIFSTLLPQRYGKAYWCKIGVRFFSTQQSVEDFSTQNSVAQYK
ncbi:Zinc finger BED domain-containing protein RICESLEEPER 3 [Bienertia sinuspersici]